MQKLKYFMLQSQDGEQMRLRQASQHDDEISIIYKAQVTKRYEMESGNQSDCKTVCLIFVFVLICVGLFISNQFKREEHLSIQEKMRQINVLWDTKNYGKTPQQAIQTAFMESRNFKQNHDIEDEGFLLAKLLLQSQNKKTAQKLNNKEHLVYEVPQWLEQVYYSVKYPRLEKLNELSLCIVATARNNMEQLRHQRFLNSILKQDYEKYKLVYVDDHSDDETVDFMDLFMEKNQIKINQRWEVVSSEERLYSLGNKIKGITRYCQHYEIIIDMDADDCLIGEKVFKIINYLYQKSDKDVWLMYSNFITEGRNKEDQKYYVKGKNRELQKQQWMVGNPKFYRTSQSQWVTSHLKTYRYDLFMKLDLKTFVDQNDCYYHWAADRFIMYGLLQLSGQNHTSYEQFYPYYYDQYIDFYSKLILVKPDKLRSQMQVPYQPLPNLSKDVSVNKVKNYEGSKFLQKDYERAKQKYDKIYGQSIKDETVEQLDEGENKFRNHE